MRVGGSCRGGVWEWSCCWRVGVEDELFDSDNLLAIAEFLQLAEKRLDLVNQSFALGALELTKDFLC